MPNWQHQMSWLSPRCTFSREARPDLCARPGVRQPHAPARPQASRAQASFAFDSCEVTQNPLYRHHQGQRICIATKLEV